MSFEKEDNIIGKILLLNFLLNSFDSVNNKKDYIFNKKYIKENPNLRYLSNCLPYIYNKEDWFSKDVFSKKELLEEKEKLEKELKKIKERNIGEINESINSL